jgi:hypothetical protein
LGIKKDRWREMGDKMRILKEWILETDSLTWIVKDLIQRPVMVISH